jgi:NAD dependent epimerase/dehydratase family enzyme
MRVVIAGAGGLIGSAVRQSYQDAGHAVQRLVRREPEKPNELRWNQAEPDVSLVDGADVLINLAGAGIGERRWSPAYRDVIQRSRVDSAHALAVLTATAGRPPSVFLSASGIRYYGIDRGAQILTENSEPVAGGLLPTVAQEWEAVPSRQLTTALAAALHRPAVLRIPLWTLRVGLGPIAAEVFGGLRVVPARLTEAGMRFHHQDIDAVLRDALAER